jgi:hypothetical protein
MLTTLSNILVYYKKPTLDFLPVCEVVTDYFKI